jgi:WD40 repeat protein
MPAAAPRDTWVAHADTVLALRPSADGKLLVTGGADRLVKIWDFATRKELAKLEGHAGPVMAVALSADGARLASAGADKEVKIWNTKTGEQTAALTTHPAAVTDLAWMPDGPNLLSACEDGSPRFSAVENKERAVRTFNNAPDVLYCAVASRDGKTIYAGCHDGSVYAWSAASGKLLGKLGSIEGAKSK